MQDLNKEATRGRWIASDYANRYIEHSNNPPTDVEIVTRILKDLMWYVESWQGVKFPDQFHRLYQEAAYRFQVMGAEE